jgi:hypothetical protein
MRIMNAGTLKFLPGTLNVPPALEKSWLGKRHVQAPKSLFRCRLSEQIQGPDIPPCQGLKVHFGMALSSEAFQTEPRARYSTMPGLENFSGPGKSFQAQAFQTELKARYSTIAGLESSFWRGIRLQVGGGRKKLLRS